MTRDPNYNLDLAISRVIRAPRQLVWSAWADTATFERWWVPAPYKCRVVAMDLRERTPLHPSCVGLLPRCRTRRANCLHERAQGRVASGDVLLSGAVDGSDHLHGSSGWHGICVRCDARQQCRLPKTRGTWLFRRLGHGCWTAGGSGRSAGSHERWAVTVSAGRHWK